MRHTEIAIVGGGLAGSTAAAMLSRDGFATFLIDPHTVYPPDFRCEKLDGGQVRILRKTGFAEAVLRAATHDVTAWVARRGHVLDKKPSDQWGILYDTLVNTLRAQVPSEVFVNAKVISIATSPDRQTLVLSNGEEISARLVVLANGLNIGLRHLLGLEREIISPCHSVAMGFDMHPVGRAGFDFKALSYYPDSAGDRIAYLTLFPIGGVMRANFMVYRDMNDPWLSQLRREPVATLRGSLPHLAKIAGDFDLAGPVKVRPADLYATRGHRQAGLVLVGDAFATSCPAAGNGAGKVFTDVERLCHVYVPQWLASEGMGEEKIASFYDDPVKQDFDKAALAKAYSLRAISIEPGAIWQAKRSWKFVSRFALGQARQLRGNPSGALGSTPELAPGSSIEEVRPAGGAPPEAAH